MEIGALLGRSTAVDANLGHREADERFERLSTSNISSEFPNLPAQFLSCCINWLADPKKRGEEMRGGACVIYALISVLHLDINFLLLYLLVRLCVLIVLAQPATTEQREHKMHPKSFPLNSGASILADERPLQPHQRSLFPTTSIQAA